MADTESAGKLGRERLHGLDLLRAVAILLVLWWHLPQSVLPFGWRPATWAGVDLFFVLSGYLIGSQLLRPYTKNARPSYWDFCLRRFYRVVPAYLAVLLLYFTVPQFREQPSISSPWRFLTFTQNFGLDAARYASFTQAWSLCVEEHFYLLLPLIVYWLMRKPSLTKAWVLVTFIVVSGLVVRAQLWLHFILPLVNQGESVPVPFLEYVYYPTYTRLDGLLVGVLLAATRLFRPVLWARITVQGDLWFALGILVLIGAFVICQDMFSFATALVGYPLLALGFGLLVLASLSKGGLLAKYRIAGATTAATLAYSTYLTHKEIMHLDRLYLGPLVPLTGMTGLAVYLCSFVVAAWILHICIERPFLRLRDRRLGILLKTSEVPD